MINNFANYNEFRLAYEYAEKRFNESEKRIKELTAKLEEGKISNQYYEFELRKHRKDKANFQKYERFYKEIFINQKTNAEMLQIILDCVNDKNNSYKIKIAKQKKNYDLNLENLELEEIKLGYSNSLILLVRSEISEQFLSHIVRDYELYTKEIMEKDKIFLLDEIETPINTPAELKNYLNKKDNSYIYNIEKVNVDLADKIRAKLFNDYLVKYENQKAKARKLTK